MTVNPDLHLSDLRPGDDSRYVYAVDAAETVAPLKNKTQVVDGRPIQPRVDLDVTAQNLQARGAVVTGLTMTSQPLTVTVARPVVDHSAGEKPIPSTEMVYPSAFQNVTTFSDASGLRNNLVLIPGQWLADTDAATKPNVGTQRSFTSMTSTVYYAAPGDTDDVQPVVTATSATKSNTGVTFTSSITDLTATGTGMIVRVSVLYLDGSTWRSTELTRTSPGQFTGAGLATTANVDYMVQAVDASGNVAVSSNKARLFSSTAAPTSGPGINGAPSVAGPASASGVVFNPIGFSGSFADADGSTAWTGTVNNGAGDTRAVVISGSGWVATLPPYAAAGTYVASVSVCDAEGACGVATVPVTVTGSGVGPTADCTVLSFGQALTWWGTQNPQPSPLTVPIGSSNKFAPGVPGRSQPTVIDPGAVPRRFTTQAPIGDRLSWFLAGSSTEALSARGCGS